jgi:predicted RNase H-like HicB family nuclease
MKATKYSAVIHGEDGGFVSFCPELDIASQGETEDSALQNLREAVELFLEFASQEEIARRELAYNNL